MEHRIVHFITNQCSEKEILELNNWAENEPQEFNHHAELYHIYMMAKATTISEDDVDLAFRRLQERINGESIEIEMRRPWWQSRHIAASIIFFLSLFGTALGWQWWNNRAVNEPEMVSVCTNANDVKNVILPDGTSVWLNNNSELSYPKEFTNIAREVRLKGEGYFNVVRKPHLPFIVHNEDQDIRVLGTVFYVSNSKAKHEYIVSLIKGSVEVNNNISNDRVILLPGQRAIANDQDGEISIDEIPATNDLLWHHKVLSFKQSTISNIMATLENIYGIDIKVKVLRHKNSTYSGEIAPKQDIEGTLKLLQLTLPFSYKKLISDSNNSYFEVTSK